MTGVVISGLFGAAPPASAGHSASVITDVPHEGSPTPPVPRYEGLCYASGSIYWDERSDAYSVPSHDHMRGIAEPSDWNNLTGFACTQTNFDGEFAFAFASGTDGPTSAAGLRPGTHGATYDAGWSHSSCYEGRCDFEGSPHAGARDLYAGTATNDATPGEPTNFGEIVMISPHGRSSTSSDNWMQFCRGIYDDDGDLQPDCENLSRGGGSASTGGSHVLAWGELTGWAHSAAKLCFFGDLTFVPDFGMRVSHFTGVLNTWTPEDDEANYPDCPQG